MSAETQTTVRYWCHICNAEVPIYMAPDITCQHCSEQFIEEVQLEDDPREFLSGAEASEDISEQLRRSRSDYLPFLYSPLASRYENSSSQSEVGDDLYQYFTPSRTRGSALDTEERTARSNSPPLGYMLQSMLTNIVRPEHTETATQRTEENRQRMLFFGNVVDSNIRFQSMPGSMPRPDNTNSEHRESVRETSSRFDSIASIVRLLSNVTGTFDDELAGNPEDYVFSQTALDNIISQLMEQTGGVSAPPPAPENVIDSLVKRSLTDYEKSQEADCAVCKDDFELKEQIIELPCDHIFHGDCIRPWLKLNSTCPVCRHSVLPQETNTESSDENNNENQTSGFSRPNSSSNSSDVNNRTTTFNFGPPPGRATTFSFWPSPDLNDNSSQDSSSNNVYN